MKRERDHSLDALRAFCMSLGIVLHAAISFMKWPLPTWPTRDMDPGIWADTIVYCIHTFRMQLFFLLSGFFACLVLSKTDVKSFIIGRCKRILIPFLASLLIIIPIMHVIAFYEESSEQLLIHTHKMAPVEFREYTHPLTFQELNQPISKSLMHFITSGEIFTKIIPMHLWFLYYLLLFYLISLILRHFLVKIQIPQKYFSLKYLIPITSVLLIPMEGWSVDSKPGWVMAPQIVAYYYFFFLIGWIVFQNKLSVFKEWSQNGLKKILAAHLLFLPILVVLTLWHVNLTLSHQEPPRFHQLFELIRLIALAGYEWLMIHALLAFAQKYFSTWKKEVFYLSDSSYWTYLISMIPIFLFQRLVSSWPIPGVLKFVLVIILSFAFTLSTYHLFVRGRWIGKLLNGK
jgi:glucan biosynthesis protein C